MALLYWLYLAVLAAQAPGATGQNTLFSSCAVRTLAGGPGSPPAGPPPGNADGASTSAQFSSPQDAVFDPASGNIYAADYFNQRVRVLAPLTGTVSTINFDFSQSVGLSDGPSAVVVAPGRTIYVSTNRSIFLVVASQTPPLVVVLPTLFNAFTQIGGLALDAATLTLYVSDKSAQAIYAVDLNNPQPRPSLLAGVPNNPEPSGQRNAFDGSLSPGSVAARFAGPAGLAFDLFNRILFVADFDANAIRTVAVTPPFTVTTIAGDITKSIQGKRPSAVGGRSQDGIGTFANFSGPIGVAMAGPGQVVVTDYYNFALRFVSLVGPTLTLTGAVGEASAEASVNAGFRDGVGSNVLFNGVTGIMPVWGNPSGGGTFAPPPDNAYSMWVLADSENNVIRMVNCTSFPPPATPTPSPRPSASPSSTSSPSANSGGGGGASSPTGASPLPPLTLGLYIGVPLAAALLGAAACVVLYYTLCKGGGIKTPPAAAAAAAGTGASIYAVSSSSDKAGMGGDKTLANPLTNIAPSSPQAGPSYSDLPGTPTGPSTSASSIQDWKR